MAFAGNFPSLKIDLNMLRGRRIRTRRNFTDDGVMPQLKVGDPVRAVEEEGDVYMATVEAIDGLRVELLLHLETCQPSVVVRTR